MPERRQGGPPSDPDAPRWAAALAGIAAGGLGLGMAELAAATVQEWRSPIVDVGDRVIIMSPSAVKEFAVAVFGTADKLALLIGIGVLLTVAAALLGVLARRHWWWAVTGITLFGAFGAASAWGARGVSVVVPSVVATLVAVAALWWLVRLTPPGPGTDTGREAGDRSRRSFLVGAGSALVGAVVVGALGRLLAARAEVAAGRDQIQLPPPSDQAPAIPPTASVDVAGVGDFTTPNATFYRIDTALMVPRIDVETHRLRVTGMVERELEFTLEDLLSRRLIESVTTLVCVSNPVGGGLVGNAVWLGAPLADILDEAGVSPAATQVVGRSVDGYTCGFPVEAATDGRAAMVAVGMNGEPLPPIHGYPIRLIVPGLYGYVSATKWLERIELTTFEAFDHYWERRGWAEKAPIRTQSRIDVPSGTGGVPPGETAIAGVAWAPTRGIQRVEVQVDDGDFREAELAAPVTDTSWRQWRIPWRAEPGSHRITCRATDGAGTTQPQERMEPIPSGATGWHTIEVVVG